VAEKNPKRRLLNAKAAKKNAKIKEKGRYMKNKLHGIFVAMVTPMKANEQVDFKKLEKHADYLIRQKVHGLIPLGSTGEYYALTPKERHDVVKATISAAKGRVPVVVGTNAGSTMDVIEYSKQAEKLGAVGILLAPPYYSLPTLDELFGHFKAVNNAIGIPIMLYNYPGRTGVDMPPDFIIEQLTKLKNVQYVKESTGEITRISKLIRCCGDRLGVFCGGDTIALESFMLGVVGWVGGTANVIPQSHVLLYELACQMCDYDDARALYFKMLPTLSLMEGDGKYTQYVKTACRLMGNNVGPLRRPLQSATPDECVRLAKALSLLEEGACCRKFTAKKK